MDKILYVGHYREGTGWGQGCLDYLLSLDKQFDVVARPIKLNNIHPELPERVLELENKSSKDCDVCIQHVLPQFMEYNGNFEKNIGLFYGETDSVKWTPWFSHLKLMDEIWVPNTFLLRACHKEFAGQPPVRLVPQPVNPEKYKKDYKLIPNQDLQENFVFYFIGETNTRKRIAAILKAFHSTFTKYDPVRLLIKTNGDVNSLIEMESDVCQRLGMYGSESKFQPALFLNERVDDEGIMSIHQTCDCFVSASYGEAWCIPAFDAMGMGNYVICPNNGGPADYLKNYPKGHLVDGVMTQCFAANPAVKQIQSARENWFNISTSDLAKAMLDAYTFDSMNESINTDLKGKMTYESHVFNTESSDSKELRPV